jgi:L-amino acid N-acyltransferase YncA
MLLNRFRNTVRSLGWVDGLTYIAGVLIARLTGRRGRLIKYYFVAQPVPQASPSARAASGNFRFFRTASPEAGSVQIDRPEHVIRQRYAQGAHCIVAERDHELAGCIWLCPEQYREDEVRCVYQWTPPSSAMWDFDVYIAPRWRISRLFARLWEHAHAELRDKGVRWTLSRIDAFNAGSLAAHRKLGAQTLGRGWFLLAGRAQLSILTMTPFVHFTWRRDAGPRLSFNLTRLDALSVATGQSAPEAASTGRSGSPESKVDGTGHLRL